MQLLLARYKWLNTHLTSQLPRCHRSLSCPLGGASIGLRSKAINSIYQCIGPSRVPYRLLDFLKQQVPMIIPQGRSELEVSAAWLLDEIFPKVKTGDFKYMPPGPKGSMTPLLNPDNIVSPTSSKMQNYIVARAMDARHTPEWAIHKQITFNGALRNYKKAKAMLMYSRMHPTEQGAMKICHIKATMKIPVMVVFSIPRREIAKARKNLAICGIRVIQAPPRLPLSMTKGVKEAVPLPNVDYIFHGYDLLFGQP
ncbi:hypothetical protein OS493_009307 [Desmophyllum pertusum]|uniref:Uncharacterized protein n=1 Tax=Desmophyllum pertusum TaxID=174260 RepID=A0A9X0CUI7_9CNID|nr:hypothetical protein OS493_009307 [Desmophyllum pertusum]